MTGFSSYWLIGATSLFLLSSPEVPQQVSAEADPRAALRAEAGRMPPRSEQFTVRAVGRANAQRTPERTEGERIARLGPKETISVAEVVEGKKTSKTLPTYPQSAIAAGIQGTVIVQGVIDREGRVGDLRVVRGIAALDKAALDAVQKFKYEPTKHKGEARAIILTVIITYVLADS